LNNERPISLNNKKDDEEDSLNNESQGSTPEEKIE
jgi:hypothetical protein